MKNCRWNELDIWKQQASWPSGSTQLPTRSCSELWCVLLLISFHLYFFAFVVLFLCTPLLDLLQRYHSNLICMNWWGQPQNSCPAIKGKFCSKAVHTRLLSVNVQATDLFYQVYLILWAVKRVEEWKMIVENKCHFRDLKKFTVRQMASQLNLNMCDSPAVCWRKK